MVFALEDYTTTPDGKLVEQAMAGNDAAFEILVKRHSTSLGSFIHRFVNDYDQMCDILQQVFLQMYHPLPALRQGASIKPWLFQVARSRCIDELRRRHHIHFSELEHSTDEDDSILPFLIPDPNGTPEEQAELHDLQQRLRRAIAGLPPHFRTIVQLRYMTQWTFAEIGSALHIPEATAKTYFQRAKIPLRASLADISPRRLTAGE